MPEIPRNRNKPGAAVPPGRPGQDIIVSQKQASQFPGIGMTLSSYQKDNTMKQSSPTPTAALAAPKRRWYRRLTLKRAFITLIVLILLIGGYLGGKSLYELHKAFGGSIFDLFHTSHLKGEDSGRVNILLAGLAGQNSGQTGGPDLTDSLMIVSLDTRNNTAWMLSVPRDLWVNVPGHGYQKINAAYEEDGIGKLEQMVSQKFGLPIDYYAVIDYQAFKQAVDAVGGVSVDIKSPDPRGLFDAYTHLQLPNGWVTLNGNQALNLARARGDDGAGDVSYGFPQSDFDRTQHQRQLLEALKTKATSAGVLANPIKLSNLFTALGNNVKTDFSLSDARRLYQLSKVIPNSKIQSLGLNNNNGQSLLTGYTAYDGEDALIPAAGFNNYSQIQAFVSQHSN